MKRVIPLRALLVSRTLLDIGAAFYGPNEPVFALRQIGGWTATGALLLMLALVGVALADIILSELNSRAWRLVRRRRWAVWLGLGAGHAVQAFVAFDYGFAPWVAGGFLLTGIFCAVVAGLDLHYRYCDRNQGLVDSGLAPLDGPLERYR